MKKRIHDFRVLENRKLSPAYFVLELECPEPLPAISPGQFAEVLVPNAPSTFLRRPFSIYDVDYERNILSMLIKNVGKGTSALSELGTGSQLNLVYPLGNSYSLPDGDSALLIGGAAGIAPMLLLSKALRSAGIKADVLIGGRTASDILEPEKYKPFATVYITTDDGSLGEKGMATGHSIFRNDGLNYSKIYACGPEPMMKAVAALAYSRAIPCEVSLENLMACGVGACLCCVVETLEGNKTTCVEGPVFDTRELKGWL